MPGTRNSQDSEEPSFSEGESESLLISSLLLTKVGKMSHRRKHKQKTISLTPLKNKRSSASDGKEANTDVEIKKVRKRKKRKSNRPQENKTDEDEAARLQRRSRYLLIKMKLEQNLIDAYSAEGWKGQSREKIRPENELERARKQILKCKLGIRDAISQLDSLSSVGSIEEKVIAPDGSIHHEHIFCAKCKLREAFRDNDIVLCDGTCNRAFHQKCLDPPLDTEKIPPGDQGWFCKFCECKMEIIESTNAHVGTQYPVDCNGEDIFMEEASFPEGGNASRNDDGEWPSDDSEDDDYDPERREYDCDVDRNNDESENAGNSASLSWSSSDNGDFSESGMPKRECEDADSDENINQEMVGRRQRRAVDYKKLYYEMFGKDAPAHEQLSEDEDWGPYKRRRREKESDAASTLITLCESDKRNRACEIMESKPNLPSGHRAGRSVFRLPPDAVERLRRVFAQNELPSKAVKDNLSKELGIDSEKISKWFKNTRYLALKNRKVQTDSSVKQEEKNAQHPIITKESGAEAVNKKDAGERAMEDSCEETVLYVPNNKEKVQLQEKAIYRQTTLDKNQPLGDTSPVVANAIKASVEASEENTSLKKIREDEKDDKIEMDDDADGDTSSEEFEILMEKICRTQETIAEMRKKIARLPIRKAQGKRSNKKACIPEESVMYVPVAELKEKEA